MAEAWANMKNTHFVDTETVQATQTMLENGYKTFADAPSLQHAKDQVENSLKGLDSLHFDVTTKELIVPCQPPVPVFLHTPKLKQRMSHPVILLYFHGGGLIISSAKATSKVCESIASKSGVIVVNVDYRLVPNKEDPMCPFNDAVAVANWVVANKKTLGGAEESKVGVAGDSSGAQISCCVSKDVSGIAFQILIYPVVDIDCSVASMKEFYSIPLFGGRDMERMFEFCLLGVEDPEVNSRFNPSANSRMNALPPTFILNAELDPVLDWALAYEKKLKTAGVPVKSSLYKGLPHIFFTLPLLFPNACERAHSEVADYIKSFAVTD